MKRLNFGWLTGKDVKAGDAPARRASFMGAVAFAAAGAAIAICTTSAQAWHYGHPHGPPAHYYKKSQAYQGHNNWKSEQYYDGHYYKKSQAYQKKKYYHQKYGSWHGHPKCLHLGPFGVCEY